MVWFQSEGSGELNPFVELQRSFFLLDLRHPRVRQAERSGNIDIPDATLFDHGQELIGIKHAA